MSRLVKIRRVPDEREAQLEHFPDQHRGARADFRAKEVFFTRLVLVWALTVLCLTLAWEARAQDCDKTGSVQEMNECAALRLRAADREMADLYGPLLESEDKEFVAALRLAQEAWMKWREAEGKLAAKTVNDQGLAQYTKTNQEALMTEDRIKDLRSMAGN